MVASEVFLITNVHFCWQLNLIENKVNGVVNAFVCQFKQLTITLLKVFAIFSLTPFGHELF